MVDNITNDFEIFVNDILDNTGKIALKYFRDIKDLSLKRDMSPVTKADKEIEKYIRTQILNHYPNHNIVGEEYKEVVAEGKTANLGRIDAMYISVINQLIAKVEALETKVAALESS